MSDATSKVPSSAEPTHCRRLVFSLCCGVSWLLYLHRYLFAMTKPALVEEWGVDPVKLAMIDTGFYASYLAFQIPAGVLTDLFGTRLFLTGAIGGWSLALGFSVLAVGVNSMMVARIIFGAAQCGTYPALVKVSKSWFPPAVRTSAQGWVGSFFGRFGAASANVIFGTVLLGWLALSWQVATLALALVGLVYSVVFWLMYRSTPAEHPGVNDAERKLIEEDEPISTSIRTSDVGEAEELTAAPRQTVSQTSQRPGLRGLGLGWTRGTANLGLLCSQHFMATLADSLFVTSIPLFLSQTHHLKFAEMGYLSSLPLFGGAMGGIAGGLLNDLLLRRWVNRRWARATIATTGNLLAGLCLVFGMLNLDRSYLFCWTLLFVKFFFDWSQPTVWGTVTDIAGQSGATVFAIINGVGGAGALVGPVLFAWIAETYSWTAVFILATAAYFAGALIWLTIDCTIPTFTDE